MKWTSVVSYHTDPETCGVARFSKQLAERLGVPHYGFTSEGLWGEHPLFSIKFSEVLRDESAAILLALHFRRGDYLWHDEPPAGTAWHVRKTRNEDRRRTWKLYEIGVPALVQRSRINDYGVDATYRALFTFGMAHKLEVDLFRRLRETELGDCELWISTAEHEGASVSRLEDLMDLWGPGARNLGHLTDDALGLVWPRVTAFVAFFEHGLRANNTSVHAALNAYVPVITNHGPETPNDLRAITHDYRAYTRKGLISPPQSPYTWTRLLKEIGCDAS